MILKRFYHEGLAQAGYLIGCPGAGEAIVIDANRHIEPIILAAEEEGMKIVAVTETHIHADYISGSRELARRTGAKLYLSSLGGPDWTYGFAEEEGAELVKEGSVIRAGGIRLEVMSTPGHTPEHISFVLYDDASGPAPAAVFTGDHVFVGDVGRPDLLERAANFEGTMEAGARVLHGTLKKFLELPDHVMIWPAHGAGSACGKSLGGVPVSTIGYEKTVNWGLRVEAEQDFVNEVLAGQPEPPLYFKEMKRINRDGPPMMNGWPSPVQLSPAALEGAEFVLDIRPSGQAMAQPLASAVNVPLGRSFTTWAGWHAPYDKPILLVAETQASADEAARELSLIGLDDVAGWVPVSALRRAGLLDQPIEALTWEEAMDLHQSGECVLLDVRGESERTLGMAEGALGIHGGHLSRLAHELPRDKTLLVYCAGGNRSPIAVSALRRMGFQAANIPAGFAGHPSAVSAG